MKRNGKCPKCGKAGPVVQVLRPEPDYVWKYYWLCEECAK